MITPEQLDDSGSTHWEGCWEFHARCAVAAVKRLQAENEEAKHLVATRTRDRNDLYKELMEEKAKLTAANERLAKAEELIKLAETIEPYDQAAHIVFEIALAQYVNASQEANV